MSTAMTRGTILKAEFTWIIRDTFKWPGIYKESLIPPSLFHADNDKEIKWGLRLENYPWRYGSFLLYLNLKECPASDSNVTARFSITASDENAGKLLHELKSDPSSFTVENCNVSHHALHMGYRDVFLKIPSVSIRVIVEYEKGQLVETTTTTSVISGSSPKSSLGLDFGNLLTSQSSSDISFIIDGKEVKAHKLILSARSPVFAAMFRSDMKEKEMDQIDIPDISPVVFNELLRFIYTDRVQLTEDNAEPLLAAANQYLLLSLKTHCEEFVIKGLSTENCVEMFVLAEMYDASHLKKMHDV